MRQLLRCLKRLQRKRLRKTVKKGEENREKSGDGSMVALSISLPLVCPEQRLPRSPW